MKADERNKNDRHRNDLIIALENSNSFANTHSVISKIKEIKQWNERDKEELCSIAVKNTQVYYILNDVDVADFYKKILNSMKTKTADAKVVADRIKYKD